VENSFNRSADPNSIEFRQKALSCNACWGICKARFLEGKIAKGKH